MPGRNGTGPIEGEGVRCRRMMGRRGNAQDCGLRQGAGMGLGRNYRENQSCERTEKECLEAKKQILQDKLNLIDKKLEAL